MNFIFNNSKKILGVLALIFAFLLFNISNFKLDASSDSLVLENDADLLYFQSLRKNYKSDSSLIIGYQVKDELLKVSQLQHLRNFTKDLKNINTVTNITSILNVPLFSSPPLSLMDLADDSVTIDKGNANLTMAKVEFNTSPIYSNNLVSSDGKTTAILVSISEQNTEKTIQNIRDIILQYNDKVKIVLGGVPMIANDIVAYIGNDLVVFSLIVITIMALVLLLIFKNLRFMLLPLGVSIIAALSMTGLLGIFGWKVTVISSNFFSLLLVMSLSVMIHLVVRYRELAQNSVLDKQQLIQNTVRQMFKPCLYTTLTTLIAFVSLFISGIRPVIDFGYMMAIGVILAFILAFISFPLIMNLLTKIHIKEHKTEFKITTIFANLTNKFGNLILVFSAILLIFSIYGINKITVENRFLDYFKESTEIHQGLSLIDKKLGGTIPLEIIFNDIGADYFNDDEIRFEIQKVHNYLDSRPEIGKVLSIDTMMQLLAKANDDIRPSGFMLSIIKSQIPDSAKKHIFYPYILEDEGQIRIVARVKEGYPNLNRKALISSIEQDIIKLGFKQNSFRISGMMVLYNNMLQSLFDSQINTISAVFLMIWLMFLLLFKSFKIATIAIVPNILPSILILGIMGNFGIPLDLMTITIAAIAIGIGVDNAIHYLTRFKAEVHNGNDYISSMFKAHSSIGLAMLYTSITVALGFIVLVFSNFVPSLYFGLFTSIAMFSAVLLNLTLLPKLLILFKPKI